MRLAVLNLLLLMYGCRATPISNRQVELIFHNEADNQTKPAFSPDSNVDESLFSGHNSPAAPIALTQSADKTTTQDPTVLNLTNKGHKLVLEQLICRYGRMSTKGPKFGYLKFPKKHKGYWSTIEKIFIVTGQDVKNIKENIDLRASCPETFTPNNHEYEFLELGVKGYKDEQVVISPRNKLSAPQKHRQGDGRSLVLCRSYHPLGLQVADIALGERQHDISGPFLAVKGYKVGSSFFLSKTPKAYLHQRCQETISHHRGANYKLFRVEIFDVEVGETHYPLFNEAALYAADANFSRIKRPRGKIIIFGESTSDPGNLHRALRKWRPLPPYFKGRFSDGPVWSEYFNLMTSLPISNHAYAASEIKTEFGLALKNLIPYVLKTDLDNRVTSYISKNKIVDSDIFFIWIGGNSANNKFYRDPKDVITKIIELMDKGINIRQRFLDLMHPDFAVLEKATKHLIAAKAKKIVLVSLPNAEKAPLLLERRLDELQFYENTHSRNLMKKYFTKAIGIYYSMHNEQVEKLTQKLKKSSGIDIRFFSEEQIAHIIATGTSEIGHSLSVGNLTNLTDRCFNGGYDGSIQSHCLDSDKYLFFDEIHPTTAGHCIISVLFINHIYDLIFRNQDYAEVMKASIALCERSAKPSS